MRAFSVLGAVARAARVQHEHGGTVWSEPTENLDFAHRGDVTLPEVESPTT